MCGVSFGDKSVAISFVQCCYIHKAVQMSDDDRISVELKC